MIITLWSLACSFPESLKLFMLFPMERKATGSGDLTSAHWSRGQGSFEALDSSQDSSNVSVLIRAQGAIGLRGDAVVMKLLPSPVA